MSDALRFIIGGTQVWKMDASGCVETWNGGHQLSLSFTPSDQEAWAKALAKQTKLLVTIEADPTEVGPSNQSLTDEQRLRVLNEVFAECGSSGGSTVVALERYHDKVKARLAG